MCVGGADCEYDIRRAGENTLHHRSRHPYQPLLVCDRGEGKPGCTSQVHVHIYMYSTLYMYMYMCIGSQLESYPPLA